MIIRPCATKASQTNSPGFFNDTVYMVAMVISNDVIEKPHAQSLGSTPTYRSRTTRSGHSHSSYNQIDWKQGGGMPCRARSVSTYSSSVHYTHPKRSDIFKSNTTMASSMSGRSGGGGPTLYPPQSSSTLVGSALERKIRDEDPIPVLSDTTSRLESLRNHMAYAHAGRRLYW